MITQSPLRFGSLIVLTGEARNAYQEHLNAFGRHWQSISPMRRNRPADIRSHRSQLKDNLYIQSVRALLKQITEEPFLEGQHSWPRWLWLQPDQLTLTLNRPEGQPSQSALASITNNGTPDYTQLRDSLVSQSRIILSDADIRHFFNQNAARIRRFDQPTTPINPAQAVQDFFTLESTRQLITENRHLL